MQRLWRAIAVAMGLSAALALGGCSTPSAPAGEQGGSMMIGVDLPLSGADASDGVTALNGIKLAIKDSNDGKLVPGFDVNLDVLDDAVNGVHDPAKGVTNFNSFVSDSPVLGVIGPLNSNVAEALIPLSNQAELALISPANTSPYLTTGAQALALRKAHPLEITYFRTCPTDDAQGSAGAIYAYQTLHARRAYVMDDNATFGRGLADQWASQFRSEGGTILGHLHARPGQTDFSDMIRAAALANPDIIFFGGESSTGAAVARKQMAGTPLAHTIYASGDGIQNQQFLDTVGAEADNSYATVASADPARLPTADTFVKEYLAAYGRPPDGYAAQGYVATRVLVEAIAKAVTQNDGKAPSREQVLEQLRATQTFSSILGVFSLDQNGDTTLKIVSIWKVDGHRWKFLTQRDFAQ